MKASAKRRLLCLNLVLLLILVLVLPVSGSQDTGAVLTLEGGGGTRDGQSTISLSGSVGYSLYDYLFQRDGYTQRAWQEGQNTEVALDAYYIPATNTTLLALWQKAEAGDLVLNGLGGLFASGRSYLYVSNYTGNATLPTSLNYPATQDALLAWCTEVAPAASASGRLSGVWYAGGTPLAANPSQATVLYARAVSNGSYAVFHPTDGALNTAGTALVYDTSVPITTPGPESLNAPEGYRFAGWADKNGSFVCAGSAQFAPDAQGTLHLYAIWETTADTTTLTNGLTLTWYPDLRKIQITGKTDAAHVICALYTMDRRLVLVAQDSVSGRTADLTLTYTGDVPPLCKVFTLETDHTAKIQAAEISLPWK